MPHGHLCKEFMDFVGASTYSEALAKIILPENPRRIENIHSMFKTKSCVCLACKAHHKHGYVLPVIAKDGSIRLATMADANHRGCFYMHFEKHKVSSNTHDDHDDDDDDSSVTKSKESFEAITDPFTKMYFAIKTISLWWSRILLRRKRKLLSIYKAKNCFAKIPVYNLADCLNSWIKKWHMQQNIDRQNKVTDMIITNWEKRRNEKEEMVNRIIKNLFNDFIQTKIHYDVACEKYLAEKRTEQKRKLLKMLCEPWRKKQKQILEHKRMSREKNHQHIQNRRKQMIKSANSAYHLIS